MSSIRITHPENVDAGVVKVPAPRPPHTFEEVYGVEGYVLAADGDDAAVTTEMPNHLRALVANAIAAGKVDAE